MNKDFEFTEEQRRTLAEKQKKIDALKEQLEVQRHNSIEMRKANDRRIMQTIPPTSTVDIIKMQADEMTRMLEENPLLNGDTTLWKHVHPRICELARPRFESRQYADAVESAFKEINVVVKKKVERCVPRSLDGVQLMQKVFSPDNPLLQVESDLESQSNIDTQRGYMFMFAGAMAAIRNPKAHENMEISKEDAIRKLHFASMLMYKVENSVLIAKEST